MGKTILALVMVLAGSSAFASTTNFIEVGDLNYSLEIDGDSAIIHGICSSTTITDWNLDGREMDASTVGGPLIFPSSPRTLQKMSAVELQDGSIEIKIKGVKQPEIFRPMTSDDHHIPFACL